MADGENTVKGKRTRGLKPPWKKGGPSPNPGGRPASAQGFRQRCRDVAAKLLERLESETFTYSTGEGGGGTDIAGMVRALEVLADRGGYLPADKQMGMLLKALESHALKDADRRRVLDELVGAPAVEAPKPPGDDPPSQS